MNRIVHVVSRREMPDPPKRLIRAWESWQQLYDCGALVPAHCWETKHDSSKIGDSRRLPMLKEVIEFGLSMCPTKTTPLLFTNDDIIIHPMAAPVVRQHVRLMGVGVGRRVSIDTSAYLLPPLSAPPTEFMALGAPDLGRDAFVITPDWYERYGGLMPDFYIGAPCWDLCFALLLRLLKGWETKGRAINELYDNMPECDIADGVFIHEAHRAYWEDHRDDPAAKANEDMFNLFCNRYYRGIDLSMLNTPSCWPLRSALRYRQLHPDSTSVQELLA